MTPIDVGISTSTSSAAHAGDIGNVSITGGSSGGGGLLGAITGSSQSSPWYVWLIGGATVLLGLVVFMKLRN